MMKKLLFLLVFAFFTANMSAQEMELFQATSGVKEVKAYLTSLDSNNPNARINYSASQHVENLLYKVQPSVYYNAGTVRTYGEKPTSLFTDINSLSGLAGAGIQKNNIEIATVRINSQSDLNGVIDLSVFSSFKNLKYVYILSTVKVTPAKLDSMITNSDERLSVFYKIDKGDSNQ